MLIAMHIIQFIAIKEFNKMTLFSRIWQDICFNTVVIIVPIIIIIKQKGVFKWITSSLYCTIKVLSIVHLSG